MMFMWREPRLAREHFDAAGFGQAHQIADGSRLDSNGQRTTPPTAALTRRHPAGTRSLCSDCSVRIWIAAKANLGEVNARAISESWDLEQTLHNFSTGTNRMWRAHRLENARRVILGEGGRDQRPEQIWGSAWVLERVDLAHLLLPGTALPPLPFAQALLTEVTYVVQIASAPVEPDAELPWAHLAERTKRRLLEAAQRRRSEPSIDLACVTRNTVAEWFVALRKLLTTSEDAVAAAQRALAEKRGVPLVDERCQPRSRTAISRDLGYRSAPKPSKWHEKIEQWTEYNALRVAPAPRSSKPGSDFTGEIPAADQLFDEADEPADRPLRDHHLVSIVGHAADRLTSRELLTRDHASKALVAELEAQFGASADLSDRLTKMLDGGIDKNISDELVDLVLTEARQQLLVEEAEEELLPHIVEHPHDEELTRRHATHIVQRMLADPAVGAQVRVPVEDLALDALARAKRELRHRPHAPIGHRSVVEC
jgi:hypothetical protein